MNGKIIVELQEFMGSDASIANAAWTSTYDKDRREEKYDDAEKVASIVPRLINEGHAVPIESVVMRFWIRHPIMTDRQHMTHRIASHNGLSGRYRTMPDDWFGLPDDCQGILHKIQHGLGAEVATAYDKVCEVAYKGYADVVQELKTAEKMGKITNSEFKRVREAVRGVLPVAGMVERTTIMNLRSFANYQRLRNSKHAQIEVRQVARLMLREVIKAEIAPVAMRTLMERGWTLETENREFEIAADGE